MFSGVLGRKAPEPEVGSLPISQTPAADDDVTHEGAAAVETAVADHRPVRHNSSRCEPEPVPPEEVPDAVLS